MHEPIIQGQGLGIRYGEEGPVFADLSVRIREGSFSYLVGESGAGKTSLLRLLDMSVAAYQGSLWIFGEEISQISRLQQERLRQDMGLIFQDFKLLDHLTALENVAIALRIRGLEGARSRSQAQDLLEWLGVTHTHLFPKELSGGEQQRVAIARAVISRPRLLIADEPTSNIDDALAVKVFYLLEELNKIGTTVILATHNQDLPLAFPHQILRLEKGVLEEVNAPSDAPLDASLAVLSPALKVSSPMSGNPVKRGLSS